MILFINLVIDKFTIIIELTSYDKKIIGVHFIFYQKIRVFNPLYFKIKKTEYFRRYLGAYFVK